MSNTMTAHEPISYLDSILNEEERRCEYGHQWRNFTISRSGRFKTKNQIKKREMVDASSIFESVSTSTSVSAKSSSASASGGVAVGVMSKEATSSRQERYTSYSSSSGSKSKSQQSSLMGAGSGPSIMREKTETYKSYYETNL